MEQKPSIGRIVHYTLTEQDAAQINRRRTTGAEIAERMATGHWPAGAQAHIGNTAVAGDTFPATIVRVFDGPEGNVNLQVFLDGTDTYWATTIAEGAPQDAGRWAWPPRS